MNKNAEIIGLKGSFYDSPHGLSNYNNKSTAADVARLSTAAMTFPKFREVVSTKYYSVKKNTNGNIFYKKKCVKGEQSQNFHLFFCILKILKIIIKDILI